MAFEYLHRGGGGGGENPVSKKRNLLEGEWKGE